MTDTKVRNPLFTFETRLTCGNFIAAKNELSWKPLPVYRKKAYAEIPVRIFYNKVNGTALCTGCGCRFPSDSSFRHNGKIKCPKCRKEAVLQNNRLFKSFSTYFNRVEADYFQKGKNGSMCRVDAVFTQEVFFDNHWDAELRRTESPLSCTVIRNNGVRVRMMYTDDGWVMSNKDTFLTSPLSWWYGPRNLFRVKLTTPKYAVRGTHFERFFDSVPEHLRTSDGLMCVTPQIEKLFKVGLYELGESYMQRLFHEAQFRKRWCDVGLKDAPVAKMLGVNRKTLACMINQDSKDIEIYRLAEKMNLSPELAAVFDDYYSFKGFVDFCEKNHLRLKKVLTIFRNDTEDTISDYKDYIKALKKVGDYPDDKRFLYPKREVFYDLHDEMTEKLASLEDAGEIKKLKAKDQMIVAFATTLSDYSFEDDAFLVRPLANVQEMYMESRLMSNCVKTYVSSYSEGNCAIFSMRPVSQPNHPIATIEVRKRGNGTYFIAQMRGKHNTALSDEKKAWLEAWLASTFNKKTRKTKRAAVCA